MRRFRSQPQGLNRLRRASNRPVWQFLLWRFLLALFLVLVALTVHWLDRGGLKDNVDGHVTFTDVLYFTMITITTVGYGDIIPVTERARLFDTFLVTPIRLFVWLIFLGTAYDFLLKDMWEKWRMSRIQKELRDHIVVVGYGTSGAEAIRELIARGISPTSIVAIDNNSGSLETAMQHGVTVMTADATRNSVLEAARVAHARAIVVSAGRDDTSILIVLTARRLAPGVPISVVIRAEDNEPLAQQAGADIVINPASFAGLLLAGSTQGPHVADYVADLVALRGSVALVEREVNPDEVGRPLADISTGLGVRIIRNGRPYGFWDVEVAHLRTGDIIVEIIPNH